MELGLQGKRAWVLGGSAGIGRAVAASLAAEGARVVISSRRGTRLDEVATELRAATGGEVTGEVLDVTDVDAITAARDAVVGRLGGLDILVSNHGGPPAGGFDDVDSEAFTDAFGLIVASAFRLTKACVPSMREQGGGVVAYLTSSSVKEALPNLFLSNVMRMAVLGMAKSLSKELAPAGIRTLCVAPGRIATERAVELDAAAARRQNVDADVVTARAQESIPLGRYGRPEEFGDVVAFLCSERASYVTGTTVLVDGGKVATVG